MLPSISDRLLAAGISQQIINDLMEDLLRRMLELEKLERESAMYARAAAAAEAGARQTRDRFEVDPSVASQASLHYQPAMVPPAFGADIPRGANVGYVNPAAIRARATTQDLLDEARASATSGDASFVDELAEATKANLAAQKVGGTIPDFKAQFTDIAMIGAKTGIIAA